MKGEENEVGAYKVRNRGGLNKEDEKREGDMRKLDIEISKS
jgi:hypothetical protein